MANIKRQTLFLVAVTGILVAVSAQEAVRIRIEHGGAEYAMKCAVEKIAKYLPGQMISEQTGTYSNIFGNFAYTASNLVISKFLTPHTMLTLDYQHVRLDLGSISIEITGELAYDEVDGFGMTERGNFSASVDSARLDVSIEIATSDSSSGILRTTICSLDVVEFNVYLGDGLVFLSLFVDAVSKDTIHGYLENQVCGALRSIIDGEMSRQLLELPNNIVLPSELVLDVSLAWLPIFHPDYIDIPLNYKVFQVDNPLDVANSCKPEWLPSLDFLDADFPLRMVNMVVSSCAINTHLDAMFRLNGFEYLFQLEESEFKKANENFLRVLCPEQGNLCVGSLFPNMSTQFPNASTVKISIKLTSAPTIDFADDSCTGSFASEIDIAAVGDKGTLNTIISVKATGSVDINATISNQTLKFFVKDAMMNFKIISSKLVGVTSDNLNTMVKGVIQDSIIPPLNRFGLTGYVIPYVDACQLLNSQILFRDNGMILFTDFMCDCSALPG